MAAKSKRDKETNYPILFQISNKKDVRDHETLLKCMKNWNFEEYNKTIQRMKTNGIEK